MVDKTWYKLTHNIDGVQSGDIQTAPDTLQPNQIFAANDGRPWVEICMYVEASPTEDTLPKLRPYFLDDFVTDQYFKGDLIYRRDANGNALPVLAGEREAFILAVVYVGNRSVRFALEACELTAVIKITVKRVSLERYTH